MHMFMRCLPLARQLVLFAAILLMGEAAVSSASELRSPLETPPVYCDESGWGRHDSGNQIKDIRTGRIECVGMLAEGPYSGSPEEAAQAFLFAHEDWVGVKPSNANLQIKCTVESPIGYHVRFVRVIDGVPVYPGDLVISMNKENRVIFYASSISTFKDLISTSSALSAVSAERIAAEYLKATGKPIASEPTELVIWAGDHRDYVPCWKYRAFHEQPRGDWEVLVDAQTGAVRRVRDRAWNVNGSGMIFMPDPLSTANVAYGAAGYVDNLDADTPQLTAQRFSVTLLDITFSGGLYRLQGPWANATDVVSPSESPPAQASSGFNFTRNQQGFEWVNCYYHLDAMQRWIQSLGFFNIQNVPINFDANGYNGADGAQYVSTGNYLHFGQGTTCVDRAEDAETIGHEYGHGIQSYQIPGWAPNTDDSWAIGEGFGDYWGASYGRAMTLNNGDVVAPWGGRPCWVPVNIQVNMHYPEDINADPHVTGRIWTQPLYEAELLLGRTTVNTTVLQSQYLYSSSMSMPAAAMALMTAEQNLHQGQFSNVYSDAFVARGLMTRPANDVCPGFGIWSLPYGYSGSTATADDDYSTAIGPTSPEVFFVLNLPCGYNVTASLCGSGYDTGIEVRTGGGCPGSTFVTNNDDFCGFQSQVSFVSQPNTNYYLIVHGYSTFAGPYTLNVSGTLTAGVPTNDTCPGTNVTGLPFSITRSTCAASHDVNTCVSSVSPDVMFNLTLTSCQTVTASLCGSDFDTGIEIRTGGNCPGSQVVACNDDACGLQSQTQFVAAAYETYYIIVDGYASSRGAYTLNLTGAPYVAANDSCPGTQILALPYTDSGNTYCATSHYLKCVGFNSRDVVYRYTSQACQTITASLCGSAYDTGLEVRRRGSCPGLDLVGCNDDGCGLQSMVTFPGTINDTYYFIVHGFGAAAGAYTIQVSATPGGVQPNDVCSGAREITTLPYLDEGNTVCATNNRLNCVGSSSPEVFYRLNLESCSDVIVRLCYSTYDTGLEVRMGGECPGSMQIACNDDNIGCDPEGSLQSIVQFKARPGENYYLIVHGFSNYAGYYVLDITGSTCAPESLVVQRQGNSAYLDWAPVTSSGSVVYRVYRATTPDGIAVPGNLVATTADAFYTDVNIITNPQVKFFYAVTADGPALVAEHLNDAPDLQRQEIPAKTITPEQREEMRQRAIPAYINPANIEKPNPAKTDSAHNLG